jgi:hypothetical protein
MNAKQKKTGIIALLVGAILLMSFKKKKPVGSVEVGEGEFGDFGTDGNLDEYIKKSTKPDLATGGYTGKTVQKMTASKVASAPITGIVPNRTAPIRSNYTKSTADERCKTC